MHPNHLIASNDSLIFAPKHHQFTELNDAMMGQARGSKERTQERLVLLKFWVQLLSAILHEPERDLTIFRLMNTGIKAVPSMIRGISYHTRAFQIHSANRRITPGDTSSMSSTRAFSWILTP